jgi:hypothetical protein
MSNNPNDEVWGGYDTENEQIREEGEEVWSSNWDFSNSPAGSSWASVYRLGHRYAPFADFDLADYGPFDSLEEALEASGLQEIN